MVAKFVGKLVITYFLLYFVTTLYWRFVRAPTDWDDYKGEWAVVTGSSYGIGAEFALSLAKRGINVVLCARTKNKLEEIQRKIQNLYPTIKTKILLMNVFEDGWENVLDEVKDLRISVLVNNIGGANIDGTMRLFHEYPEEHHQSIHKLNLFSMQKMIFKIIPQMVKRKKGRIINVSSTGIYFAYKLSVYPADKAFMNQFTEQLNSEYEEYNIRVESLLVGEVTTPALGNKPADGLLTCNPEEITENALNLWGWSEIYAPFYGHAFIVWSTQTLLPKFVLRPISRFVIEYDTTTHVAKGNQIISDIHEKKN